MAEKINAEIKSFMAETTCDEVVLQRGWYKLCLIPSKCSSLALYLINTEQ